MISSIDVVGYRGFERFEMTDLGRLNLLVGTNNSGKTSVLEALHLLTSRGDPMPLWQLLWRRGERLPGEHNPRNPTPDLDVSHLFTGHKADIGSKFTFSAKNETPEHNVAFSIAERSSKQQEELFSAGETSAIKSRLVLRINGTPPAPVPSLPLSRGLGISPEVFELPPRRFRRRVVGEESPSQFITTESLNSEDLVGLWDKVALTPNEELVLRALQFLDPAIERIAPQSSTNYYQVRGGFILKLRGYEDPIPIGSMGDGMWRMLAMAIAITQCKGGVLLVDEIDTGLHYTVMSDMWRLIFGAAKDLDVQVFATTHSFDCIHSLASVCMTDTDPDNKVTLQRIEAGKVKAVPYTESEIKVAAEKNLEVR